MIGSYCHILILVRAQAQNAPGVCIRPQDMGNLIRERPAFDLPGTFIEVGWHGN